MGFVDKVKDALSGHEDQADQAIDKVGDFVDSKTGGQHAAQVDQAQEFLKGQIRKEQAGEARAQN